MHETRDIKHRLKQTSNDLLEEMMEKGKHWAASGCGKLCLAEAKQGLRPTEGYEIIKIVADSGASDHVAPPSTAAHIEIEETEMSRSGLYYTAANGQKIDNVGQRTIRALTEDGNKVAMTWQIAAIKRPLASIGKMCDAGNSAIFTKEGGYIVPESALRGLMQQIESKGQALKMNRED